MGGFASFGEIGVDRFGHLAFRAFLDDGTEGLFRQVGSGFEWVIGDGDAHRLFHLQTNLRFGCVILRHYLDREKGDLFMALGRYNGSRGRPEYPNAVLASRRQWLMSA